MNQKHAPGHFECVCVEPVVSTDDEPTITVVVDSIERAERLDVS